MGDAIYTPVGNGEKLLWSVDFGAGASAGKDMVRALEVLGEIESLRLKAANRAGLPVLSASTSRGAGVPTDGSVDQSVVSALLRELMEAKRLGSCAILVEDGAGDLRIARDAQGGGVTERTARNAGDRARLSASAAGSPRLSDEELATAWDEAVPVEAVRLLEEARGPRAAREAEIEGMGMSLASSIKAASRRPMDGKSQGRTAPAATDRSKHMAANEDGKAFAEAARKSYPLTVRRNFILSDKATGAPVITDRVGKASGKAYQTCQVTIPGGTKTVQNGQVVDLSGYQATMFVNKNVTDPEKRDVTFYLDTARDVTLFKTDRETGERSYVTVTAGELSHAVAQERRKWQQAHQRPQQDKATDEVAKEDAKAAGKPRREFKMTPESAAQPATEAQMRKLSTLMEAGAVTQAEVDAVSNKGEASQLISLALEMPANAPEGYVSDEPPQPVSEGRHFAAAPREAAEDVSL